MKMKKNNKNQENEEIKEDNQKVKTKKEKKEKKQKKPKVKKEKNKENKVKIKEKISLSIRKRWLVNGTRTVLLMAIFVLAFIALNLGISTLDLPEIDVTASKVYSLSEDSKKAIEKVNQDVKIYVYGYEEDSQLLKFL